MNKEDFKKELKVYEDNLKQEVIAIVKKQWVKENSLDEDDKDYDDFGEFTIDLERDITDIAFFDPAEEGAVVRSINGISCKGDLLNLYWWHNRCSWERLYLEDKERLVRELKSMYQE